MLIVCPGRRDKEPADIAAALEAMHGLGLIAWDRCAATVQFPPSFYKHQTYITEKRRNAAQPEPPTEPTDETAADQRSTAQNGAPPREDAQNTASFKSSFSSSSSSSVSESTGPNGPDGESPPDDPPTPIPKPRTPKQLASDRLHERRMELYGAYCAGVGIKPDSMAWRQAEQRSFRELKPVLDEPELTGEAMEQLSHYTAIAYRWRKGKTTPAVVEVLAAWVEWEQLGRPAEPPVEGPNSRGAGSGITATYEFLKESS